VVKQPKGLNSVEAASIWMMFITAYGALIEDAKITARRRGHSRRIEQRGAGSDPDAPLIEGR
jgi:NADPH:quinone reductase-like Zn-dependent oxidoreductase